MTMHTPQLRHIRLYENSSYYSPYCFRTYLGETVFTPLLFREVESTENAGTRNCTFPRQLYTVTRDSLIVLLNGAMILSYSYYTYFAIVFTMRFFNIEAS